LGDVNKIEELLYPSWRERMLEMCLNPPSRICPFCGQVYNGNAEYIDVGVCSVQVTVNYCENPECGAQEQGCYVYKSDAWEFANGWVRHKYESLPELDFGRRDEL
jgi:hypothetical protein